MRNFKCADCGYTWERPFGDGVRGMDLECPECGSSNIHRTDKKRGPGRSGRGREAGTGRRRGIQQD